MLTANERWQLHLLLGFVRRGMPGTVAAIAKANNIKFFFW